VQSAAILLTLIGIAALTGLLIGGSDGLVFAAGLAALFLIISATAGDELFMRAYGAVRATPAIAPDLVRVLAELGRRAGLPRTPALYIVPSSILQALAAGSRNAPAIAVTSGLLHALPAREVAAVLAHEAAHIRHGDTFLMRLAAAAGIMTHAMATTGLFLLIAYLPILRAAEAAVPWPAIVLLVGTPLVSDLLQLSLSRRREFLADAGAVELTGDPVALANALRRIEALQGDDWERFATRGWRWLHWLRTHPTTRERLERLAALVAPAHPEPALPFGAWSRPLRDLAPLGGHAWPQRLARRIMP
jgi:heat shock protein HtpX